MENESQLHSWIHVPSHRGHHLEVGEHTIPPYTLDGRPFGDRTGYQTKFHFTTGSAMESD